MFNLRPVIATLCASLALPALASTVNINTASADQLDEALLGVGPTLAARIVRDRQANGPYAAADDLARVQRIGAGLVDTNREWIRVE